MHKMRKSETQLKGCSLGSTRRALWHKTNPAIIIPILLSSAFWIQIVDQLFHFKLNLQQVLKSLPYCDFAAVAQPLSLLPTGACRAVAAPAADCARALAQARHSACAAAGAKAC
jgi:hypothetical protein